MLLRGQGATEYLVLLAVVLIVALVSVALLGFFPGMASDTQITQSQAYWASAQPISITEWAAVNWGPPSTEYSVPYLRLRNVGSYPIRIMKFLGPAGQEISVLYLGGSNGNISDYFYLAPGEEKFIGDTRYFTVPYTRYITFRMASACSSNTYVLCAANSICEAPNSTARGNLVVQTFGFEYVEYIDGQQVTKRQVGSKPLVIKCTG